ncbi:MAG TPA: hypothetical protein VL992_18605 [Tepidisphaeraceae bacterium]|nr:hypothetical protein [Tepidisphaeraceae bacterium]
MKPVRLIPLIVLAIATSAFAQDLPGLNGTFSAPSSVVYQYPAGARGWFKHGFRVENDSTRDWRDWYGLQFDVRSSNDTPFDLTATISIPPQPVRMDYVPKTTATVAIAGAGWHRVTLPWSAFDFPQAEPALLKFVSQIRISASGGGQIAVTNAHLIRARQISLDCDIRGKACDGDQRIQYIVTVTNCADHPQAVSLTISRHGWEEMAASVDPPRLDLAPGASGMCTVDVTVPSRVPPGGHETQVVQAIADGDAADAAEIGFITTRQLPHPNILHTIDGWNDVRQKVKDYAWAKADADDFVRRAEQWEVPEIAEPPGNDPHDKSGPFLFASEQHTNLFNAAVAWQLTGKRLFAEKAALLLRRLSDPDHGYPKTFRACPQSLVQEGEFFQHSALAYDMILDSGVLSDADKSQIERTFRDYIETVRLEAETGAINNWNVSEFTGALYCALAIEDLHEADRFFSGPSGILDQISKGVMDDGWWYECAISYNVWCATEFSQVAMAMRPWGVNLRDMQIPAGFSPNFSIVPWATRPGLYGMSFQKFGPVTHNSVGIKRMWDALPTFVDYRGVMFGVNDAQERHQDAQPYEIAYDLYRDPVYAGIVSRSSRRDLLYGVPELPKQPPDLSNESAFADNVGLAMLRSQTPGRPRSQQIQAVLHYGTLGGFHGHFDRTNLLSLMRYGRSFYNPEMIWYGYLNFMYKFYVQTSVSKNMVVVDEKMQEPVESQRLLFHTGKMMQATAVQTNARWSNPPYGGMVYDWFAGNFADKCWDEGRSVPIPANAPAYGDIGPYSDRVLQRRAMIVTDDYVVLADYLRGSREHHYESLMQIKGFDALDAPVKILLRHTGQWSTDPLSSAQFVTDCDWYDVAAPAVARFATDWTGGGPDAMQGPATNVPGWLKLDVHSLWPPRQTIMIGSAPEDRDTQKQLHYTVTGDGNILADGQFGSWILGQADIDVPVDGLRRLQLQTTVAKSNRPTIFWANARIVKRDGREVPLGQLSPRLENVLMPRRAGEDYFGGPITIVGIHYPQATAGEPDDPHQPAIISVDLSGLDAVRFKAILGGDYPHDPQQRRTYAVGTTGTQARFITLIEPYDKTPVVRNAVADSADSLRVELTDGRVQTIRLANFEGDGSDLRISMTESRNGQLIRAETAGDLEDGTTLKP